MERNEDSRNLLDNIDFPQQGLTPEETYETLEAAADIDVREQHEKNAAHDQGQNSLKK